jgi:hypothetical protein
LIGTTIQILQRVTVPLLAPKPNKMTVSQKSSIFRRCALIALVCGSSAILPHSSSATALSRKAPQIGLLPGVTAKVLERVNGQLPCRYYLSKIASSVRGNSGFYPVFDRQQEDRPVMNIDGQNITLQLVRRKIKSPTKTLATNLPELSQEVFAYRRLRVTIDYQVVNDDPYVTTYDALITARRDGLTTRLKARGEYGCPDFRS